MPIPFCGLLLFVVCCFLFVVCCPMCNYIHCKNKQHENHEAEEEETTSLNLHKLLTFFLSNKMYDIPSPRAQHQMTGSTALHNVKAVIILDCFRMGFSLTT